LSAANFGHRMERQYGMSSATHPTPYSRAPSSTRSTATVTRTNVAAIARSIQTGAMNVSQQNVVPTRTINRLGQLSSERRLQNIHVDTQRAKLSSQSSLVCLRVIDRCRRATDRLLCFSRLESCGNT
jgi:hypothetical protein